MGWEERAIETMAADWLAAKETERAAMERRRQIEDQIRELIELDPTKEGTTTLERGRYVIKVVSRVDRKVDADKLQELAGAAGLTDVLPYLFRWKPEINLPAWKMADEAITTPLAGAVTAKPGRPSFSVVVKEE